MNMMISVIFGRILIIKKQKLQVEKLKKMNTKKISSNVNYEDIKGLLTETRQKLQKIKPETIGQASRIPGVTPSDIAILLVYLKKVKGE